jgi:hypothetical protein
MTLPFTVEQFMGVFAEYNNAIWPVQILLNLLGIGAVVLVLWRRGSSRLVSAILASLWAWSGAVYHLTFFATINPAAAAFGALFLLQALVFVVYGTILGKQNFQFQSNLRGWTGALIMAYGMLVYPILGHMLGHQFPFSPTFGVPCPTTIFTFGLLLWTVGRIKWYVIILPFLWSLIGFTAAFKLGIAEDMGLLVAGVVGTGMILAENRQKTVNSEQSDLA